MAIRLPSFASITTCSTSSTGTFLGYPTVPNPATEYEELDEITRNMIQREILRATLGIEPPKPILDTKEKKDYDDSTITRDITFDE